MAIPVKVVRHHISGKTMFEHRYRAILDYPYSIVLNYKYSMSNNAQISSTVAACYFLKRKNHYGE